ncbi:STAS/SEC14 domain-containing protein [Haloarcula sp. Atlit-7R]|uniref:STAS/SEC14 domain-containing protein n=1 Tax=Haloarcula sp. Atlit-7R TaxID=2282125 RepID=UPI000EF13688|nr:STAS/SEC14 domain-containing protein [Haloarcula sp. Atlit-7R]RLM91175.1 STAS/SEC14 domain-containing protein [Haloarcula sp. Atlit-7R]
MYELLEATENNVIALQMHNGTRSGYQEFYELLSEKTSKYGAIHVYEETTDWTVWTFLTHLTGLIPDVRYGSEFAIKRYAAVGDNVWARLLYELWKVIRPLWPVAPTEMRYFDVDDRDEALRWVKYGEIV